MKVIWQQAFGLGLAAAVLTASGPCVLAQGRPIEFSEPHPSWKETNSSTVIPGRTRLDHLEAELSRSFNPWSPGKTLDGVILTTPQPQPAPPVQGPRSRGNEDRKRDLMFLTPEEIGGGRSLDSLLNGLELTPDGRDISQIRPLEREYLRLTQGRNTTPTNRMLNPFPGSVGGTFGGTPGIGTFMPDAVSEIEKSLRRTFDRDLASGARRITGEEIFSGLNSGFKPGARLSEAELQRREAYLKILDYNNSRPMDAAIPAAGNPFSTRYVDSSFYDPPKPAGAAPDSGLGGSLSGGTLTPKSPTTLAPAPVPPPPVKPPPAPSPFLTIPRRNF